MESPVKSVSRLLLVLLLVCLADCTEYDNYGKNTDNNSDDGIWVTGVSKTYEIALEAGTRTEDGISGGTFVFPDGGGGTLKIRRIVKGPYTTEDMNAFTVEYSGAGKILLELAGKPGEQMLTGYCPLDGSGILTDDAPEGFSSIWIPLPEQAGKIGTVIFDLPVGSGQLKSGWPGISAFKSFNQREIKDKSEQFKAMRDSALKELIRAIPLDKQSDVRTKYLEQMPEVYVHSSVGTPGYSPFWNFPYLGRKYLLFKPESHKSNVAHECGHYMHHILVGDFFNSFYSRGVHAVGEKGARENIIEEPAFLSEYFLTGQVGAKNLIVYNARKDPEMGNFCIYHEQTKGPVHSPDKVDFLDLEGFGIELMAAACRTRDTILNYKEEKVTVPVLMPEMTDRTPIFRDLYGMIESGVRDMPGISLGMQTLAFLKWGGNDSFKKLQVMWQPLGYCYSAKLTFVDADGKLVEGIKASSLITIGNQEYVLNKNMNQSDSKGICLLNEVFPLTSSLRIYYKENGVDKTRDIEDFFDIPWNAPTNVPIEKKVILDESGLLAILHKTTFVSVIFAGSVVLSEGSTAARFNVEMSSGGSGKPLIWNGREFSVAGKYSLMSGGSRYDFDLSISGKVSQDCKILETVTGSNTVKIYQGNDALIETRVDDLSFHDIGIFRYTEQNDPAFDYYISGAEGEGKVNKVSSRTIELPPHGNSDVNIKSILWNDDNPETLKVYFGVYR